MKIYISADMEGVTGVSSWEECESGHRDYPKFAVQMTREVAAACEGAIDAGATEIVVKDAHDTGMNIDISALPEDVELIRRWSGHPYSMVEGLDGTFDALIFIGYHSGAGSMGNPLSHTMTSNFNHILINGEYASEYTIFSLVAAYEGVPVVFLSGDRQLCTDNQAHNPGLKTLGVKEGRGIGIKSMVPTKACRLIRENVKSALKQDLKKAVMTLPERFEIEICFKDHALASRMSYYPGIHKKNSNTLTYESDDYWEVLRMFRFVL